MTSVLGIYQWTKDTYSKLIRKSNLLQRNLSLKKVNCSTFNMEIIRLRLKVQLFRDTVLGTERMK